MCQIIWMNLRSWHRKTAHWGDKGMDEVATTLWRLNNPQFDLHRLHRVYALSRPNKTSCDQLLTLRAQDETPIVTSACRCFCVQMKHHSRMACCCRPDTVKRWTAGRVASPLSPAGPAGWRPPAAARQCSGLPPELSPEPRRRRWASLCTGCWCWNSNPAAHTHTYTQRHTHTHTDILI